MYDNCKNSISQWIIFVVFSILIWYRNIKYDRIIAVFLFTTSLIPLVEYGIYNHADPKQAGKALFIILCLQTLVLSISVFVYINTKKSLITDKNKSIIHFISWLVFIFYSFIFIIALGSTFLFDKIEIKGSLDEFGNIVWTDENQNFMNNFIWVYSIGIILPLLLLFCFHKCEDNGLLILIILTVLLLFYYYFHYKNGRKQNNVICVLPEIFIIVAWISVYLDFY